MEKHTSTLSARFKQLLSFWIVDIGGMEEVIDAVKNAVLFPLQFPGIFSGSAGLLSPPRGVLLYGPPGEVAVVPLCFSFDLLILFGDCFQVAERLCWPRRLPKNLGHPLSVLFPSPSILVLIFMVPLCIIQT